MKTLRWLLFVSLLFGSVPGVRANSEMFPATGAAVDKIGWKDGYFVINGNPTYLSSGEIHYARVPRELWRDRLWRAKQMGLNCIQTYVFWNVSEPKEGQWDFSDNTDLDAWLSLIQELGMYAIVRVGPYSCAEWDHGGFPAWLTIKKDMVVRDNDPQYLHYVDEHMAKIYAIVAKHQISKGGSVILVQLENEHPKGYGTQAYPYLNHLYDKARAAGLEVPMFFSGEHHSNEPIRDAIVMPGNSPWFTTEFYTGWLHHYGDMSLESLRQTTRATWKIIAFGGAGYDYYVVHGGTNFGYSADVINLDPDLDVLALNGHKATATSRAPLEATYDYTAPIGEAGQFHNYYGPARQAAYFAQTFASLIATSSYKADLAKGTSAGVRVTPRQSPNGTVVFVDDFTQGKPGIDPTADVTTKVAVTGMGEFPRGGNLVIHPHGIRTLLFNLPWTPATKLESVSTNILLRHQMGSKELWVCYGEPNEYGEVTLNRTKPGAQTKYGFTYPSDASVQEIDLDSGDGKTIELLVVNTAQANQTWLVNDRIIVGASFVREDGTIEFPPEGGKATVYASTGKSTVVANKIEVEPLPKLTNWAWRDATAEKAVDYPDDKWLESQGPQALQYYDGFQNHYGWYRTTLHTDAATTENLQIMGKNGYFQPFLNGKPADFHKLALKPGDNKLAVFVKIGPRPKLGGFIGAVGTRAYSGLWGDYTTADKPIDTVVKWKKSSMAGSEAELSNPEFDDRSWESISYNLLANNETKLEQKTTWLRGTFQIPTNLTRAFAYFPAVHGAIGARLFINGQVVEPNESKGYFSPWSLSDLIKPGTNTVALMITNKENSVATIEPKMEIWPTDPPTVWKFHGGLEGLEETAVIGRVTNWNSFMDRPWNQEGAPAPGLPTFWKVNFDYHPKNWETLGLVTTGLTDGHVWLNGHNLGESPQVHLMYMPECWLKEGTNSLVILDIAGTRPSQVALDRYEVRQVVRNGVTSK